MAVHEMLWVPFPVTDTLRELDTSGPSVRPLPESVQLMALTPEGSVALTLPVTGTCEPLKYPAWPLGAEGSVSVTTGAAPSAAAIVQHWDAPGD